MFIVAGGNPQPPSLNDSPGSSILMQNVPFTNQVLQCISQIPRPTLKGRGQIMLTQQVNMNKAKF